MKNKIVGYIIISIAILIGLIIYSFNRALTNIVNQSCSHGSTCPMWGTIKFQTSIGIGIFMVVVLIGVYFIFIADKVTTKLKEQTKIEKNEIVIPPELNEEERSVLQKVIAADGTIFQSDLVDEENFTKVKITRILDKLEGRGLIERKRRGMTNVVILKH